MKFFIVDAFTEQIFGGNPAGVVILPEGSDFPSDEVCVKTAAELRYSETAFIKNLGGNEFQVRYFTPVAEVELCGHATIGSFAALLYSGVIKNGETYLNHTISGDLEIVVSDGFVLMDMAKPVKIGEISEKDKLDELYEVMGISYDEQLKKGLKLLPQLISTGLPDIMMPVMELSDLEAIEPDMKKLSELSKEYEVTGVHAFTRDKLDGENVSCHTRNFAPLYDIDEEAATGTSSGALSYYGYLNGFISSGDDIRYIQGEKMKRPSLILSSLETDGDSLRIRVGGSAAILAEGEINL